MPSNDSPPLTLLVLAAGMGSRYGGLKQMDPVGPGGETILDYSVFDAVRSGFSRVVFVIRSEMREAFESQVACKFSSQIGVDYVIQDPHDLPQGFSAPPERVKPWGTGHAVLAARDVINGPFAVVNADDFYGRDSFAKVAQFFQETADQETAYAIAAFRLANTLSENGTVARGICTVGKNSHLLGVEELTNISRTATGAQNTAPDGTTRELTGDEPASMNFWALRPALFDQLEEEFRAFLSDPSRLEKGEFYIPAAIDARIKKGDATVSVLKTDSEWFGVTYKEDRPGVIASIASLVDSGEYPDSLWSS
ncbi:NTP transferase domain-containing protein [Verrucomicrobiales bacterium]|nr:NTP transferase domain-containing protein [Verrucomicrobiales bacterium]